MQDREHCGTPRGRESTHQLVQLDHMADIEVRRRFVEQQDGRLLGERLRENDAPTLSAGELQHRTIRQVLHGHSFHRFAHRLPIGLRTRSPPGEVRRAPHQHELQHRDRERGQDVLRHHRDHPRGLAPAHGVRIASAHADIARRRPQGPRRHAHERRLAAPVRSDESNDLTRARRHIDAVQHLVHAVRGADVTQIKDRLRHPGGSSRVRAGATRGRRARRSGP